MDEDKVYIKLSKKNIYYVLGGMLGGLSVLLMGKILNRGKGSLVRLVKEGIAFGEWVGGKIDEIKENMEDILAEAKVLYFKDREELFKLVEKERELLDRLERLIQKNGVAKREYHKEGENE